MTTPHPIGDADAGKPAAQPNDSTAVGHKLLDDLQGKYMAGSKPENVAQLVKDGILPAGSTVLDVGAVRDHLTSDQKQLADLQGKGPADTTGAKKAVDDATTAVGQDQKAIDAAKGKIDPVEKQIKDQQDKDAQVKKDFDTVSGALKETGVSKDDLTRLAGDAKQPADVKEAANRLLATFHDRVSHGARGGTIHSSASEYESSTGFLGLGGQKLTKDGIAHATEHHNEQNAAKEQSLVPAKNDLAMAETKKAGDEATLKNDQKALDGLNTQNTGTEAQKAELQKHIKEEQAALAPDSSLDKAARVVKGGGYYQVAENLLGVDDKKGPTTEQAKELKLLTSILQDEAKSLNGGHLPAYLKQNDLLLKPENLQRVMDRLAAAEAPKTQPVTRQAGDPVNPDQTTA